MKYIHCNVINHCLFILSVAHTCVLTKFIVLRVNSLPFTFCGAYRRVGIQSLLQKLHCDTQIIWVNGHATVATDIRVAFPAGGVAWASIGPAKPSLALTSRKPVPTVTGAGTEFLTEPGVTQTATVVSLARPDMVTGLILSSHISFAG